MDRAYTTNCPICQTQILDRCWVCGYNPNKTIRYDRLEILVTCTECLQTYDKSQVFCTNENDPNELVCKKCLRLVF